MLNQSYITEKHRSKLINWIISINDQFNLLEETLFLSINIIDRFLSNHADFKVSKLQLLGVSAMFTASKYQEIYAPELKDFVIVSGNNCSKDEVLKMECSILKTLNFNILTVSPLQFYNRMYFISANSLKNELHSMKYNKMYFVGLFIIELSLLEYDLIKYSPSVIASASFLIARKLCEITPLWPKSILSSQGFNETKLVNECAAEMVVMIKKEKQSNLTSLRNKFLKEEFFRAYELFGKHSSLKSSTVVAQ